MSDVKKFDYVIVGGGSAGCVVANRLSEDPSVTVCLLEAGPKESRKGRIPLMLHALMGDPQRNWDRYTVKQPNLNNRAIYQPCGRGLGGGSAINSMIYIRGFKPDYDNWAAQGNFGWGYDDVLPYFKKSEDHQDGESEYHGVGGELSVSRLRHVERPTEVLLDAARECGYPVVDDFNHANVEGFAPYQVTQVNGERCSSARAFIEPAQSRPNLTVITGTHVSRVMFDGQEGLPRASGVEYRQDGVTKTVEATREVVLSAGAVGSAQLLLLSGIGPAEHLQEMGIAQVADVPGVGQNFQDHIDVGMSFHAKPGFGLGISPQFMPRAIKGVWQYFAGGRRGVFASNVVEGGGFIRTNPEEDAPDVQFHFLSGNASNNGRSLNYGHSFTLTACVLRPNSRGQLRLAAADPMVPPAIDPCFLTQEGDLKTLVDGVKVVKQLLTSDAFKPYRKGQRFPDMALGSDEAIVEHIKANAGTAYHPVGTCKMGPESDSMAVVSPELSVRGVSGLRVADASIMPTIVSGNTNAPSIMIGEKASDLVKASWKN
ncbi:hypothetical protein HBA55_36570 [Pseudomaricurvus alkylphenolicus]|uniref:GMC family oxidoreductase n=1 Tax=Pseudomaricurvus alkylphenolicus TaxID=1306991 RepID=UPI00142242C2|nr:GMC family oxidoreductase N-terminal domain-containing protein [Pseudomaricurvus alkylphenolicus]NIB45151.1 hypothetical protein [Pseudomaricurvus alkylphenolicus]